MIVPANRDSLISPDFTYELVIMTIYIVFLCFHTLWHQPQNLRALMCENRTKLVLM